MACYASQEISICLARWTRRAKTSIPPSFPGNAPTRLYDVPTPKKYVCKYLKKDVCEYKETTKKNLANLTEICS